MGVFFLVDAVPNIVSIMCICAQLCELTQIHPHFQSQRSHPWVIIKLIDICAGTELGRCTNSRLAVYIPADLTR